MPNPTIGIYEAVGDIVNIRREPRIVEYKVGKNFFTNRVGQINAGTQKRIFSIVTNKDNSTWGRVSESDSAGIAEWICIRNTNRVFMVPVDGQTPEVVIPPVGLEARVAALEVWARSKGFTVSGLS